MKKISVMFLSLCSVYALASIDEDIVNQTPFGGDEKGSVLANLFDKLNSTVYAEQPAQAVEAPTPIVQAVAEEVEQVATKATDSVVEVVKEAAKEVAEKVSDVTDAAAKAVTKEESVSIFKKASDRIKSSTKACVDTCMNAVANNQNIVAYALVGTGVSAGVLLYCNEQEEAGITLGAASVAAGLAVHPTSRAYILAAVSAVQQTVKKYSSATAQYVAKHPVAVGITAGGAAVVAIGACLYVVAQNGEQVEVTQVA